MVHGGAGLARVPGGRVALVRGGIPGELVRASLTEVKGVLQGEVEEVLEASPDRVEPPEHPGLDYGHIRYSRQQELKAAVVEDALRRAPGKPEIQFHPLQPSPLEWAYRNTVQPAVRSRRLGYRVPGSDEVQTLERDPVAFAGINRCWGELLERGLPKGVREVVLRANDGGDVLVALIATSPQRTLLPFAHELVQAGIAVGVTYARFDPRGRFRGGHERLAGERHILQQYGEHLLSVSVSSFAQPNPAAASLLYRELATIAPRVDTAVELFAGSGGISFHLAPRVGRIEAVEIDRGSVARGEADAARLGIDNVTFRAINARKYELPANVELIAVDPPRAGLNKETRAQITESGARHLVYVSCDPATWARDVGAFTQDGWRVVFARPYDFFPHTHHVELLSLLSRD